MTSETRTPSDGSTRGTPIDGGRVLVFGAAGMLGTQVLCDAPEGFEPIAAVRGGTLPELPREFPLVGGIDAAEPLDVDAALRFAGDARAVVHCVAYTNVDGAEADPAAAERGNTRSAEVLAQACVERSIPLVLISTDFVFDGRAREPYTEDAPTNPLSVYGRTKLAGEERAFAIHPTGTCVLRTQWLYGRNGRHFPGTILRLAREGKPLRIVADQVGAPTSTAALAPAIWDLVRLGARGVFHGACEGRASWYELAVAVLDLAGVEADVSPCSTAEFPRPAVRPAFSALNCRRLADLRGGPLPDWQVALRSFMGPSPDPTPSWPSTVS